MLIVIVESQTMEFVENFPTNFATQLIESVKSKSFSFLHTSRPLLPGVEGLGGDEPEQTPLVPWLEGPSLLLLDSEVIFILSMFLISNMVRVSIAWRAWCRVLRNMLQYFPQISFNMGPT